MTLSQAAGTRERRATVQTVLALFAILSLILSAMALALVRPDPVLAAPPPHTVMATTTDCSATALNKQIDWSGNDTDVIGSMHSNAGIHVSGTSNDVSTTVTYNGGTEEAPVCAFVTNNAGHTGGLLTPTSVPPQTPPTFATPACTFTFGGSGDTDLHTQDGGAGELDVWLDADTLKPGSYCKTGPGKLQQSRQGVDGHVSFYAVGHIDLANGSDTDLTPFREDGVLLHSIADGFDAITVAGSGSDVTPGNSDHSFYRGIVFAPNGEAETGGQHITIGCIVAETVKLNGSNHIISGCGEPTPPLPTITVDKTANPLSLPEPGGDFTFTVVVTNTSAETVTITSLEDDVYGTLTGDADCQVGTVLAAINGSCTFSFTGAFTGDPDASQTDVVEVCVDDGEQNVVCDDDDAIVTITDIEPAITVVKTANPLGLPQPGGNFTFTVVVTNTTAEAVTIDSLEDDVYGVLTGDADCQVGTVLAANNGSCTFSFIGAFTGVAGDDQTDVVTVCVSDDEENEACEDDDAVVVITGLNPTLVIDKVANAEVITISGPNNALVATPSIVTWTLSFTLTNGPVTGAVITDAVPAGFTFLDAADGGSLVGGTTVTWNLGTLTSSGSVSFRTTVNPATISRTAPTVNTTVIDSNETPPDTGTDSVTVTVQPPPLGGNPTPAAPTPAIPNTALGTGIGGQPVMVLVAILLIGSLAVLASTNVRSRRRRQV